MASVMLTMANSVMQTCTLIRRQAATCVYMYMQCEIFPLRDMASQSAVGSNLDCSNLFVTRQSQVVHIIDVMRNQEYS